MQFLNRLTATPLTLAAALCGACSPGKLDPDDKCPGEYNSEDITTGCINIPDPPTSPSTASSAESSDVPTTGPGSSTETSSTGSTTMASSTGEVTTENVDDTSSGTTMMGPMCGNGEVEGDEQCDDKNAVDDDKCRNNCMVAVCGDGVENISEGEEKEPCDDGNPNNEDNCLNCVIAVCGDEVINQEKDERGDVKEQCEDADATKCLDCKVIRWVFVTNGTFKGDLGGVGGADAKCNAAKGELPGTYMAWISSSDPKSAPATRFDSTTFKGRYMLPPMIDPIPVADGWMDLTTLKGGEEGHYLQNPVNRDSSGMILMEAFAWTNTNPEGEKNVNNQNCKDWTTAIDNVDAPSGLTGNPSVTNAEWTLNVSIQCKTVPANKARLYCFQVSP